MTAVAGRAWMTPPETVETTAVVAVLRLLAADRTTCVAAPSGLAAASIVPADSGAAVAELDAAMRNSPATAVKPRPTKNLFKSFSLYWRSTSAGRSLAPIYPTELVVRLARSRAQFALAHPLQIVNDQIGASFIQPNPRDGESSRTRVNLRNFIVNSQLDDGLARLTGPKLPLSRSRMAR